MPVSYARTQLSDSIGYTEILDSKFKTNTIKICFLQPLEDKRAAACALASSLIATSNRQYPSMAALSRKMGSMYGASISASANKYGDLQGIVLSASVIDNAYALQKEDLMQELLNLLLTTIFDPNVTKNGFTDFEFQIKKKDLLDTIEAEINEKRAYAISQAMKIAYQNEPAAISSYGTKEAVLSLTPASTYAAYQKMLQTAPIEIYYVGAQPQPQLKAAMQSAFSKLTRTNITACHFISPSTAKSEPKTEIEPLPVNQSKLVMVFKSECKDTFAMALMNAIFGGTPSAKLFANVREKLSLCYYCASLFSENKQSIFVDSGVEHDNLEKAKAEILHQLETIQNGEISDDELQNARMSIYNSIHGIGDTPSSYIGWYFHGQCKKEILTKEEALARYNACTKEQIIEAARSLRLDTVYIMDTKEQEA